ncbi:MAG TPA: DUF4157 domain-containing protein [Acidobacteriaceae bacterium]
MDSKTPAKTLPQPRAARPPTPAPAGEPLHLADRRLMESRFGHDFSRVRVHHGEDAAQSAAALHASAYTVGPSIVFARDRYAPHTEPGRSLLAHELVHVAQQQHLRPAADAPLASPTHPLEQNARDAVSHQAPIARASRPMLLRSPDPAPSSLLGNNALTLNGHSIAGDHQAVDQLLSSQLTVGPFLQPLYLGIATPLTGVAALLRSIAPTIPEGELRGLVSYAWAQKVAGVRQLPPISSIPLPLSPAPAPGATPAVTPTPDAPAAGDPSGWSPSVGYQLVLNLVRGSAPPVSGGLQRQYTLGDNLQVVLQDATSAGTYQAFAGAQGLTPNLLDSKILQLQPFMQLLAGFSQAPGTLSATMTVQFSVGAQLTVKFGPVTLQISAGFQVTAQPGQPSQYGLTGSAMLGPSSPGPNGIQTFGPRNSYGFGVGPPPPITLPDGRQVQPGGGMLLFSGTIPGS